MFNVDKPVCPITTSEFYINTDVLYISSATNTIYINKKGGLVMFDVEKIKSYYNGLIAERDEAVCKALAEKDARIEEAFEIAKKEIEEKVVAEIIAEAEAPFIHDIQLCEQFMKPEEVAEPVEAEAVSVASVIVGE